MEEVERCGIRAQNRIRKSNDLIRQSNILQAQTAALLSKSEKIECGAVKPAEVRAKLLAESRNPTLELLVDTALRITDAEMGNLQLFDPETGALHIAAQYGFRREFLDYFDSVHAGEGACGQAFKTGGRIIVEDVTESAIFRGTPALEVLLDAGVRAVQSTPLIARSGAVLGILSTYWSSPHRPSQQELVQLDLLAQTAADCM